MFRDEDEVAKIREEVSALRVAFAAERTDLLDKALSRAGDVLEHVVKDVAQTYADSPSPSNCLRLSRMLFEAMERDYPASSAKFIGEKLIECSDKVYPKLSEERERTEAWLRQNMDPDAGAGQ